MDADWLFAPNLSPDNVFSTSGNAASNNPDGLWWNRTFGAVNSAGNQSIFEAGIAEDAPMLTMTVQGLTPGVSYDFYTMYWHDTNGDWRSMAGTNPGDMKLFNRFGPAAGIENAIAGTRASAAAWTTPPLGPTFQPLFTDGNRTALLGKFGTVVADGSGVAQVYIDDSPNAGAARTFWDGVAYVQAGTPVFLTASIDRGTGELTVNNTTSQAFTVQSYSVTSAAGGLNATVWDTVTPGGAGTFDPVNTWTVTAPASPGTTPWATELAEGSTVAGTGGVLAATNGELNLGNVWQKTTFEDVLVNLTLDNGAVLTIAPEFTGDAILPGDLDGVGGITIADYEVLMSNMFADLTGTTAAQRYSMGDLTGNGEVNYYDFRSFQLAYDAAHGDGAFAAMVPEPGAGLLLAIGGIGLAAIRLRKVKVARRAVCGLVAVCLASLIAAQGYAAPVTGWFVDTSFGGGAAVPPTALSNAGTSSPTLGDGTADAVNNTALFAEIAPISLSAGQQIVLSGTLNMSGAIETAGGLRFGLLNETGNPPDNFGWLGYWAQGGGNGNIASRDPSGTNFETETSASTAGGRGFTLSTGVANPNPAFLNSTYQYNLTVGRFDDGTVTAHATLTSDAGQLMRVYRATESDPTRLTVDFNRVGFLATNGILADQIQFNNVDVSVQNIVAPKLQVGSDGSVSIVNATGAAVDLKYYEITSAGGQLNTGGWSSLDTGVAGGWTEAGAISASVIAEGNLTGTTNLANNGSIPLGTAATAGASDLQFFYGLPDGSIYRGMVEYVSSTVPGDFNSDGNVDGADFVIWQTNFPNNNGNATLATGDANGDGNVDGADFVIWQTNFPTISGSVTPVPEPMGLSLAALAALGMAVVVRRSRK